MKKTRFLSTTIVFLLVAWVVAYGQEEETDKKLTVEVGADLVSSYVWRGMYQSGASFQPAVSLSTFGFTLGAWGSTDFSTSFKEIDLCLSYEFGGFRATISDYWFSGEGTSYYKNAREAHNLEASLGFTFSKKIPLSLVVNTLFYGGDDVDVQERQQYSTYISSTFPFSFGDFDCEAGISVTPRKGMYSDKFDIVSISAKTTKKLHLSASYALPVFVELLFSPAKDNAFIIFGIQF